MRRLANDAVLETLADTPNRAAGRVDAELAAARKEIERLGETVKEQPWRGR